MGIPKKQKKMYLETVMDLSITPKSTNYAVNVKVIDSSIRNWTTLIEQTAPPGAYPKISFDWIDKKMEMQISLKVDWETSHSDKIATGLMEVFMHIVGDHIFAELGQYKEFSAYTIKTKKLTSKKNVK